MAEFEIEVADKGAIKAQQCCIALDKAGNPRVAYKTNAGNVLVASRDNGEWTKEELGSGVVIADVEHRIWLEIASNGNPRIAYRTFDGVLFYGEKEDGRWTFTPVPTDQFNEPGSVGGIAFRLHPGLSDGMFRDTPHFAATDLSTGSLVYARRIDGAFKRIVAAQPIDLTGDGDFSENGHHPSMAHDELSGTLLFAYVHRLGDQNRVDIRRLIDISAGTFNAAQTLDSGSFVVSSTSVFSGSQSWVAYCEVTNLQLKAGLFLGGEPNVETVASVGGRIVPSMASNRARQGGPENNLRIAYVDNGKLKLAARARGVGWSVQDVDDADAGTPSLVYDNAGIGHIAYARGDELKHATVTE